MASIKHLLSLVAGTFLAISTQAAPDSTNSACANPPETGSMPDSALEKKQSLRAKIVLTDGSSLACELRSPALTFTVAFAEKILIPLADIESIDFSVGNKPSIIHFENGDRLTASLSDKTILVHSLVGDFGIEVRNINQIAFKPDQQDSIRHLLYWNTFESPEATANPAIGFKGTLLSGEFVRGKVGKALQTTIHQNNLTFSIPPQTLASKGCIEFWAKLDLDTDSFSTGAKPRFFWLSPVGNVGGIRIDYTANNGVGVGGLTALFYNMSCGNFSYGYRYDYRSILGDDPDGWHHYALIWNREGIEVGTSDKPSIAIFLDGKLVSKQIPSRDPLMIDDTVERENVFIVAPPDKTDSHPVPFAIDELKIWNYDKTDFGDH